MHDFHFLRPSWLLLFIPFFVLIFLLMRKKNHTNVWNQICSKDLIPYVLKGSTLKNHSLLYAGLFVAVSLLVIGFAGPTWQALPQPLIKSQSSLVIVLDLSPAMDAEDIKPSRLKRAIYKINDLLNTRKDGQTALVVFSGDSFVVTPLTDDVETIKALLPVLDTSLMPSSGQRVSKAIAKATELFAQAGRSNGSILLVTSALQSKEMAASTESALKAGVNISILGVGTDENAPIPKRNGGFVADEKGALVITTLAKDNLSQLAKRTQGVYTTIRVDDSDIQLLVQHLSNLHERHAQEEMTFKQTKWHDQGYLLVVLALPFFCLFFRKGVLLSLCFLLPHTLQASAWSDFFKTRDQRAEVLFQQENYQEAKDLFKNQEWKGAANFRLGEYKAAAESFQANTTADGLYNFGTAKAKEGDFKSALKAYAAALEIEPEHADALYNKKLIEDWQKQQEQEKQDKKENQKQEKQQDQPNDQQQKDQQDPSENDQNQEQEQQQDQKQDKQEQTNQQNQENDSSQNQSGEQQQNGKQKESAREQESSAKMNAKETKDEAAEKELQNQYKEQLDKELEKSGQPQEEQPVEQNEMPPDNPQRQMDERWLQRIPDDPGALLRRKFQHQYKNQNKVGF